MYLGVVSRFSTEKSFKTSEGTCFSKENASNELSIEQSKRIFYDKTLIYK